MNNHQSDAKYLFEEDVFLYFFLSQHQLKSKTKLEVSEIHQSFNFQIDFHSHMNCSSLQTQRPDRPALRRHKNSQPVENRP